MKWSFSILRNSNVTSFSLVARIDCIFFRICSSEDTVAVALLSSFSLRSLSFILPVIYRANSTVFICKVPLSEKNESFILCMCSFYKIFTVRKNKEIVSKQLDELTYEIWYLLCLLISSRLCSISSYISTYTGGKCRELNAILFAPWLEALSPLSSPLEAFVDVGRRAPLSWLYELSGDLTLAKPVLRTKNLDFGSDIT